MNQKGQQNQYHVSDNVIESMRNIPASVGNAVAHDLVGQMSSDIVNSLFGTSKKTEEIQVRKPETQPIHNFRANPEYQNISSLEDKNLEQSIRAVRMELLALMKEMRSLNADVQKAVREEPVQVGVYHKNFYERLRQLIVLIRQDIADSRTWLALSHSRRKKRNYWGMYKKHGTTFGLSHERTMATSTG